MTGALKSIYVEKYNGNVHHKQGLGTSLILTTQPLFSALL